MSDLDAILAEYGPGNNGGDPLVKSGLAALTPGCDLGDVAGALRRWVPLLPSSPLDRRTERGRAIAALKTAKVADAAGLVDAALPAAVASAGLQGQAVAVKDPEPWADPVDATILDDARRFLVRFLALPSGADRVLTAFVAHTYAMDASDVATYLVVTSPAPQCGKTRLLEVLELLVWRPWRTTVLSTAVLFRKLDQNQPTLLLDEAEIVRGKGEAADGVRALLHAGYRRGAQVDRCVGDDFQLRQFGVFGPKIFAVIGDLPSTLFDRCIVVEMQRKARGETVERFRPRHLVAEARALRRQLRRWANDCGQLLATVEPPLPEFLNDREQEIWGPLFAVAAVAGAEWPQALAAAAHSLAGGRDVGGLGLQLLADIRGVFADADRASSAQMVEALNRIEGRQWPDWNRGKGLTQNILARLLKPFGIIPKTIRTLEGTPKGYLRDQFGDSWARYVPQTATATPTATDFPAPTLDCCGVAVPGGDIEGEEGSETVPGPPFALVREWGEGPTEPPGDDAVAAA